VVNKKDQKVVKANEALTKAKDLEKKTGKTVPQKLRYDLRKAIHEMDTE